MKNRITSKVHALMNDPGPSGPFSPAGLLGYTARVFGGLVRMRARCYEKGIFRIHRFPCTVISIGNITSGGTGKTPMTLHVARTLRRLGLRVVIISRGYRGEAEKRGGIVSDGENLLMSPRTAGDEPFMMARFLKEIPVLVGKNRVNSCRLAVSRFSPDVILLDDGFQHRRLHRDIDIVLLDSTRPFGNTFLLPRGSLREPPDALFRAHILVFTRWRDNLTDPSSMLPEPVQNKPVFFSRNVPFIHTVTGPHPASFDLRETDNPDKLKDARVFAFSAIADNRDFHDLLTNLGCHIAGTAGFSDHHAYGLQDLEMITRKALANSADFLVTTQKDYYKLPQSTEWPLPVVVLGVLPSFVGKKENHFNEVLIKFLEQKIGRKWQ